MRSELVRPSGDPQQVARASEQIKHTGGQKSTDIYFNIQTVLIAKVVAMVGDQYLSNVQSMRPLISSW